VSPSPSPFFRKIWEFMTFEAYGPYSDTILVLSPEIAWASELKMSDQKMTNEKVGPLPANCSGLANPVFQSGTTLIELSIVIAVLLLLVGVLFIGITAWKSGAKQSGMHSEFLEYSKSVRGYQNLDGLNTGATLTVATMTTAGYWATVPVSPAGGTYTPLSTVPSVGVAA
jgi:hypothetical protein